MEEKQTEPKARSQVETPKEAAARLGYVHPRTITRMAHKGKLRGVHIGSRFFIVSASIDELLASGEKA
jgi:excisionase family DNA binding protein